MSLGFSNQGHSLASRTVPNLEDQVSVSEFPYDRVIQAPGSHLVAFCNLQR
jgi:hypothetical protein